ncbi:hypothetical protein SAMN05216474_0813 [Lishizhenia tianjinensis]|uniref:Uncharacterized protein n=1 Tax=Lishizhenia tianjinensis TaxID=477690 RepID=A0A1I6YDQ0_9FLAO|nr:hypothetical protein [Lishizhenia tianjinensis]SFT48334.1 hypothetical protein SAMN05216474_0813 [Lishizhenia tianjinensis]
MEDFFVLLKGLKDDYPSDLIGFYHSDQLLHKKLTKKIHHSTKPINPTILIGYIDFKGFEFKIYLKTIWNHQKNSSIFAPVKTNNKNNMCCLMCIEMYAKGKII